MSVQGMGKRAKEGHSREGCIGGVQRVSVQWKGVQGRCALGVCKERVCKRKECSGGMQKVSVQGRDTLGVCKGGVCLRCVKSERANEKCSGGVQKAGVQGKSERAREGCVSVHRVSVQMKGVQRGCAKGECARQGRVCKG